MSFKRIVGIIIMAIITAEVLSACGVRPEEKESRAETALQNKYGKEFEVLAVYAGGPQPFAEDPNISIEDYAALNPLNIFRVELLVIPDGKDPEALYNSIGNLFSGMDCLSGAIRLYLVNEEQMDAAQEYLEAHDGLYSEYLELTKGFFRLEIPYQKGTLDMGGEAFADAVKEVL